MILAIISDIHSNKEALEAVLAAIAAEPVDTILCLGDIVGYGPDPNDCAREVFARCGSIVRGNHDKAVVRLIDLEWFNSAARESALWNRRNASDETLAALRTLPKGPVELDDGVVICHGTPVDEDEYMLSSAAVEESYRWIDARQPGTMCCFHGHSHLPMVIERPRAQKAGQSASKRKRNPPESREPRTSSILDRSASRGMVIRGRLLVYLTPRAWCTGT